MNDLTKLYSLFLGFLSKHQYQLIKGPVVNMDNHFNEVFSLFNPLNSEFSLEYRIIDTFPSCISFHSFSKCNKDNFKSCVHKLDKLAIESLNNPSHTLIIMNASIKNNIAMSISHIHIHNKPITKMLYHCYGTLWILTIFILFYFIFSDFIWILFFFSFFLDDEEACDMEVT